jgi:two-component system, OmpR family, phosphate regulon response regulator PhoB
MSTMLLVEDDKSLGATLSERLTKEGFGVDWVDSLTLARQKLHSKNYDLLIFDVGLSDGSGFDLAREVRAKKDTPIIFVTAQSSAEHRLLGYELGAEEFIPKPFHLREFMLRVHHVLENHTPLKAYKFEDVTVDFSAMTMDVSGRRELLNQKEIGVLRLLIGLSPKVVSRDELLNQVWGEDDFPSNRTVDNIIVRLRQILGPKGAALIRSVRGVGYQWQTNSSEGES